MSPRLNDEPLKYEAAMASQVALHIEEMCVWEALNELEERPIELEERRLELENRQLELENRQRRIYRKLGPVELTQHPTDAQFWEIIEQDAPEIRKITASSATAVAGARA